MLSSTNQVVLFSVIYTEKKFFVHQPKQEFKLDP